jgi:hypothetical protein
MVIVGPLAVIGVATMMIMKSVASAPLAKDDAAGVVPVPQTPPSTAAPKTVSVAAIPTASIATISPKPQEADQATINEINRLRAENEQLKRLATQNTKPTELSPVEILREVNQFAPILLKRIQVQEKELWAAANKAIIGNDSDVTDTFVLLSTDVQRTDSLINPMIGVIRVKQDFWTVSRQYPEIAGGLTRIITIEVVPLTSGKWKCVKAEQKIDHDTPIGDAASRTGQLADSTESMRPLVEQ